MRLRGSIAAVAVLGVIAAACSSNTAATTTTAAATTTTTKAATTTTAAATTTTTTKATTTTAAATTTTKAADLKSSSPNAALLDATILTAAELDASKPEGIAKVVDFATAGVTTTVTGPISFDGVVSIFPAAAASLYGDSLKKGEAHYGANEGDIGLLADGTPGVIVDILAVKFTSADTGAKFVADATQVAVQIGGAVSTDHPEFKPDADNVLPGAVLRVPPAPGSDPAQETVVGGLLYPNGVYYLCTLISAPGVITDDQILALVTGQSAKYEAAKPNLASLGDT